VELGYRGSGEVLKREEFEARKRDIEEAKTKSTVKVAKVLGSAALDLTGYPFLQ